MKKTQGLLAGAALLLVLGLAGCPKAPTPTAPPPGSEAVKPSSAPGTTDTGSPYRDEHGHFSLVPPAGWTRLDYPGDPRSKVQFRCPEAPDVRIIIIAQPPAPGQTPDTIVQSIRDQEWEIEDRVPEAQASTDPATFQGMPAAHGTIIVPGRLHQEQTFFVAGKTLFNLTYSAPSEKLHRQYRQVAQHSFDTMTIGKSGQASSPTAEDQMSAPFLRIAEIRSGRGDIEGAKQSIRDGLEKYPDDSRLKEALKTLEKGRPLAPQLGPTAATE